VSDGVKNDEQATVEAQVNQIVRAYFALGQAVDYSALALATDQAIEAGNLEPNNPDFWRAVSAELRRRATDV
jgi:hypothetical protein